MPGRIYSVGSGYRYGFNGQEKSDEIEEELNTAEFWEYDTRTGRRWNRDPKPRIGSSDYITLSNNPILNLDILGDVAKVGTLTPSKLDPYNEFKKEDAVAALVQDWAKLSGLKLTVNSKTGELESGGVATNKGVSQKARTDIQNLINSKGTVYIDFTAMTGSKGSDIGDAETSFVTINLQTVKNLVLGTPKDLNKMTMGIGMVTLHELGHTYLHGYYKHSDDELTKFGIIGEADVRGNEIRKEMGAEWGARLSYTNIVIQGYKYYPFSPGALKALQNIIAQFLAGVDESKIIPPSHGVIKEKTTLRGSVLGF